MSAVTYKELGVCITVRNDLIVESELQEVVPELAEEWRAVSHVQHPFILLMTMPDCPLEDHSHP